MQQLWKLSQAEWNTVLLYTKDWVITIAGLFILSF